MSQPLIAVVIPTHNRSDLLAMTLRSVQSQSHSNLEVVITDDASTDDTEAVVLAAAKLDSRLSFVGFKEKVGGWYARNQGIFLHTSAPYVYNLDSDDLLHPDTLAILLERLEAEPDYDAVVCQMAHFEHDPNEAEYLWNTFHGDEIRKRFLRHDPVFGIHAPLWRRQPLEKLKGFDTSLKVCGEYDLHVRACLSGVNFKLIPELLTYCRRHGGNVSASKKYPRLATLHRLFKEYALSTQDPTDLHLMGETQLWLARIAAASRQNDYIAPAAGEAGRLLRTSTVWYSLLCRMAALTQKHRPLRWATEWASARGIDLDLRESWYHSHKVADEPNLVVRPVPPSSFKVD